MRRCTAATRLRRALRVQLVWKHVRKNEYGNPIDFRGAYKTSDSNDSRPATGSKPQDPRAPEGREARLEWLKQVNAGYDMPKMSDTIEQVKRRDGVHRVNWFGERDVVKRDEEEKHWLEKRRKEMAKKGERFLAGFSLLMMLWFANSFYKMMKRKKPDHPAKHVYVGELVELVLEIDGKIMEPFVVGLFTQRAPFACENFSRLVSGDNPDGLKLQDTPFFSLDNNAIYGGCITHQDARGGAVVIPDCKTRLPTEDPELPPFKYALVSCAKGFLANGGFTSIFGILATDNPAAFGNKKHGDFERAAHERVRGVGRSAVTGDHYHYSRYPLDPVEDGGYVFGTIVQGQEVFEQVFGSLRSTAPYFKPNRDVKIHSCSVIVKDLPGKKEVPLS
eukprot:TRINITY_DN1606_c0_g2_i3.p1 TRINITY_DN1606_c0_g2~~TRINITY_DN1606_c0_g2_i3.p1  ORF type:complete len:390 (+),score=74.74 TRINITY_DN1606_c0_g2_i3:36-1205(+)